MQRNSRLVETLNTMAKQKGVTPSQLAIAWVLAKNERYVPVVGARKRSQVEESLGAAAITLTASDLATMEDAIPPDAVAGSRYGEDQMKMLDSERA